MADLTSRVKWRVVDALDTACDWTHPVTHAELWLRLTRRIPNSHCPLAMLGYRLETRWFSTAEREARYAAGSLPVKETQ